MTLKKHVKSEKCELMIDCFDQRLLAHLGNKDKKKLKEDNSAVHQYRDSSLTVAKRCRD